MRYLPTLVLASAITAGATIMSVPPTETPTRVSTNPGELDVTLGSGSRVRFILDGGKTVRVELDVGGRQVTSELRTCMLPSSIAANSLLLIRDDLREDEYRRESVTLLFDVGLEQERRFGKLPRVQLSWEKGALVTALITRQTSVSSGFSSPLCNPDV